VKLLLDADVLLDTALRREPFAAESDRLIQWCQETPQAALVAWHSISNLYYLLRAAHSNAGAREFITDLMRFAVVAVAGPRR
jgi:predicted nucleic acid-binding protein